MNMNIFYYIYIYIYNISIWLSVCSCIVHEYTFAYKYVYLSDSSVCVGKALRPRSIDLRDVSKFLRVLVQSPLGGLKLRLCPDVSNLMPRS